MKTKLVLAFATIFLFSAKAVGQTFRYTDLAVKFESPKPNSVITSPEVINYKFKISNQGPDTLFPSDTLVYSTGHSFQFKPTESKIALNKTVAPGDSFVISDSISVNSGRSTDNFNIFFVQVPLAYGPDNGKLKLVSEFSEDRENNKSNITLKHVGNAQVIVSSTNTLKVYPNPTSTGTFTISGNTPIKSVQLINNWGQRVQLKTHKLTESAFSIEVQDAVPGVYFAEVNFTESVGIHKLIIQ